MASNSAMRLNSGDKPRASAFTRAVKGCATHRQHACRRSHAPELTINLMASPPIKKRNLAAVLSGPSRLTIMALI